MKNIWIDGMMGVVTGDALGMPVQFMKRDVVRRNPVKTMRGYGVYNMPPGTWSDDSSMAFATLAALCENEEVNYEDIMERFCRWLFNGEYTPAGVAFDQGQTCEEAIIKYAQGCDYKKCGRTGEMANGNGALMRIMPACLYAYEKLVREEWNLNQALDCVHQISALTHNHMRSRMACGIYFFMVKNIIEGHTSLSERLQSGIDDAMSFYHEDILNLVELAYYSNLLCLDEFAESGEDEISGSGYVVESLEAAVWGLITTDSLEECLLKVVNLGDDSDTVGAIAGGLAGLFYGYDSAPEDWRRQIIREEELVNMCKKMSKKFDAR